MTREGKDWFFAYPPYDGCDFLARVLGRRLEPLACRLRHFERVEDEAYPHLVPAYGGLVQGGLVPLQPGDHWLLDDEFGVNHGFYRRVQVNVELGKEFRLAWTLIGGPALSLAIQVQEDSEST